MERVTTPSEAWVLVCDGSKAIFYQNVGSARHIDLQAKHTLEEHHAATRELGTDRPGRSYDSHDGSRSAVAASDLHQEGETKFLKDVAARLEQIMSDEAATALLILAPPRALGILRGELGPASRKLLRTELAKDLVKMPKLRIETYLEEQGQLA